MPEAESPIGIERLTSGLGDPNTELSPAKLFDSADLEIETRRATQN